MKVKFRILPCPPIFMQGKVVEEGTYVVIECPHCQEIKTLFDTFNPDDSAGIDEFVGIQQFTCEGCNKFFEIEFEEL